MLALLVVKAYLTFFIILTEKRLVPFHADVVFLIDSSSDVIWDNFLREKDFVKSITTFMNADQKHTRLAAITYGSFAQGQAELVNESDVFLSNLNRAPYVGGQRRMDLAIEKAAEILEGSRFSVPKVVILLTAGKNSFKGRQLLANASQGLQDLGVNTYVVAIGRNVDIKELGSTVDDERDIFNVSQFARLPETSESISKAIIERAGKREFTYFLPTEGIRNQEAVHVHPKHIHESSSMSLPDKHKSKAQRGR